MTYLFDYLLCPTFHVNLIFFYLNFLWKWLLFVFVQPFISLYIYIYVCVCVCVFVCLCVYIYNNNNNSHPQLMDFTWLKVHITQGGVRDKTRSFSPSTTLNFCFFPKWRCTCLKRDQHQYIAPREVDLVKKRKVYYCLKLFESKRDNNLIRLTSSWSKC